MCYLSWLWIFVLFLQNGVFTNSENTCENLSPQSSIDIDSIVGLWYGVEIIDHLIDQASGTENSSCPIMHISGHVSPHPIRYSPSGIPEENNDEIKTLRVSWNEDGESTEYSMKLNASVPGLWTSSRFMSISSLKLEDLEGPVKVLKAVGSYLVLNFCDQKPNEHNLSVILSRTPNSQDNKFITAVHASLQRKAQVTTGARKVCNNVCACT